MSKIMDEKKVLAIIKSIIPEISSVSDESNLIEFGLDSIRTLKLINELKKRSIFVTFDELFKDPTLESWLNILGKKLNIDNNKREKENIEICAQSSNLSDVQQAYMIGREDSHLLGGVGCHAYFEFDCEDLNISELKNAWISLLSQHQMLRAKFTKEYTQFISETSFHDKLIVNDLSDCDFDLISKSLQEKRNILSHKKMSIDKGEVIRCELSILPNSKFRVHFNVDLIVADVKSIQILLNDFARFYLGDTVDIHLSNWSFPEHVERKKRKNIKELKLSESYWKNRINLLPTYPELPVKKYVDIPRPPKFVRRSMVLKSSEWKSIKKVALSFGITPSMLLLTAYAEILNRWSSNYHFLINIPLFDRDLSPDLIDKAVGDFSNILLLEVNFNKLKTILEMARDIQLQFQKDVSYSSYSGIQVLRDLSQFKKSHNLIAPVVFACNIGIPLILQKAKKVFGEISYMISQTPQVWLDCQIYEVGSELQISWDCVDSLFMPNVIDDMFDCFGKLILSLVHNPNKLMSSWSDLPNYQKNFVKNNIKIELSSNSFDLLFPKILNNANENPNNIAIIEYERNLKYVELSEMSLNTAAYILYKGAIKSDAIAISLDSGIDYSIAILGVLRAGACFVPLNSNLPLDRKEKIIRSANIKFVISNKKKACTFPDISNLEIIDISVCKIFSNYSFVNVSSLNIFPSDPAYIIFTSGSTGTPKGVQISHGSCANTILDINERYDINTEDSILAVSAFDFDLSIFDYLGILSAGGTVVALSETDRRDSFMHLQLINKNNITIWNSVPILFEMLLQVMEHVPKKLPLKHVFLSGDWISISLAESIIKDFPNVLLTAMGGATECSIWSNYFEVHEKIDSVFKSVPYGKPLKNQVYRIVDKFGFDCPFYVQGELLIGGAGVAIQYIGDTELTSKKFFIDKSSRWYRTGDIGRYHFDGNIEFLGRNDSQVKIRGHRIEIGEIENILKKHSLVKNAVVVVVNNNNISDLVAYIVATEINNQEVYFDFISQYLPEYMIPKRIIFLENMPITSNGKPDRNYLAGLPVDFSTQGGSKSSNYFELLIKKIWSVVLDIKESNISNNDNFFSLGGNSLTLVKVFWRLSKKLPDYDFTLGDLYNYQTVASLSRHYQNKITSSPSFYSVIPFYCSKTKFTCIYIHEGGGNISCYSYVAAATKSYADSFAIVPNDNFLTVNLSTIENMAMNYFEAIRWKFQPESVILVGHCAGGHIAYQIAKLFEDIIEPIKHLIMINSHPYFNIPFSSDGLDWLRITLIYLSIPLEPFSLDTGALFELLVAEGRYNPSTSFCKNSFNPLFLKKDKDVLLRNIYEFCISNHLISIDIPLSYFIFTSSILEKTRNAMITFDPPHIYRTPTTFFRTSEDDLSFPNYHTYWENCVSSDFTLSKVAGTHFSVLNNNFSSPIVDRIISLIEVK